MPNIYHDIIYKAPTTATPAVVTIDEGDVLTITAGSWPGGVSVAGVSVALAPSDVAVYINRDGSGITISDAALPFGEGVAEYIDRLAWKEGDAWHIMRMVSDAER